MDNLHTHLGGLNVGDVNNLALTAKPM